MEMQTLQWAPYEHLFHTQFRPNVSKGAIVIVLAEY